MKCCLILRRQNYLITFYYNISNMKKFIKMISVAAMVVLFASCTSVKETAPVMAIGGNNIHTNIKADIDYKGVKKISGSATTTRVLWIFNHTANGNKQIKANNKYKGLNKAEAVALYRAKNGADVDMVLEPEFETETKSYFFGIFKRTKVNMTGWGANIKGFKEYELLPNSTVGFSSNGLF